VRYWMQMAEDVRVECEKEKALMRKEIEKMRAEKEEAIHQRDEAKKIDFRQDLRGCQSYDILTCSGRSG
ncbi:MAG: hypothetical protein IKE24_09300, partial [Clostridia bacterium]|nr:hypothetical protein [Clostridia bacterium]